METRMNSSLVITVPTQMPVKRWQICSKDLNLNLDLLFTYVFYVGVDGTRRIGVRLFLSMLHWKS